MQAKRGLYAIDEISRGALEAERVFHRFCSQALPRALCLPQRHAAKCILLQMV